MKRLVLTLAGLAGAALVAQACTSDLGSLSRNRSSAADINDHGVAVGGAQDGILRTYAVKYGPNGATALPVLPGAGLDLPGPVSDAFAIANDGSILGYCNTGDSTALRPVLWDSAGAIHDLSPLVGLSAFPVAMNNARVAVGISFRSGAVHAWVYDAASGRVSELPGASSDPTAYPNPRGIGDQGDIVGSFGLYPVLWTAGTYTKIQLQLPSGAKEGQALAVNGSGTIVGTIDAKPAVWPSATSAPTIFPTGHEELRTGRVVAINDAGTMVGFIQQDCRPADSCIGVLPATVAVKWTADGQRVELDEVPHPAFGPNSPYSMATAVNSSGTIVGQRRADGILRATRFE
jgi:uncharacterized membrane protein